MDFVAMKKNLARKQLNSSKSNTKLSAEDLEKLVQLYNQDRLPKNTPKNIRNTVEKEVNRLKKHEAVKMEQKLESLTKDQLIEKFRKEETNKIKKREEKMVQKYCKMEEEKRNKINETAIKKADRIKNKSKKKNNEEKSAPIKNFMDKINDAFAVNEPEHSRQTEPVELKPPINFVPNLLSGEIEKLIDSLRTQINRIEKEEERLKLLTQKRQEKLSLKRSELEQRLASLMHTESQKDKDKKLVELEQKLKEQEELNKQLLDHKKDKTENLANRSSQDQKKPEDELNQQLPEKENLTDIFNEEETKEEEELNNSLFENETGEHESMSEEEHNSNYESPIIRIKT